MSVARLGQPDLGLISYGEMLDQGRNICGAVDFPVIGDGDTGYGNALNVERTVKGYMQAGFAAIMIEDQVAPKRCGHTRGKRTVDRDEAYARVQAAVDAREAGTDILVMARTDANAIHGLDAAIERGPIFAEKGVIMPPSTMESPDASSDILRSSRRTLGRTFAPKTVAVIGAPEAPRSVGRTLLWNLISNPFGGTVFPVNPKRPSVLGIRASTSYCSTRSILPRSVKAICMSR